MSGYARVGQGMSEFVWVCQGMLRYVKLCQGMSGMSSMSRYDWVNKSLILYVRNFLKNYLKVRLQ